VGSASAVESSSAVAAGMREDAAELAARAGKRPASAMAGLSSPR
jgi:hypothetical protein